MRKLECQKFFSLLVYNRTFGFWNNPQRIQFSKLDGVIDCAGMHSQWRKFSLNESFPITDTLIDFLSYYVSSLHSFQEIEQFRFLEN